jgi:predicted small integral membrane protein
MQDAFGWMAWTLPVAIFFGAVGLLLLGMTLWQIKSPTIERRGLLPLATTRGDRLFIGLLAAAYLNLIWAGVTDLHQGIGAALGFLLLLIVMRWG